MRIKGHVIQLRPTATQESYLYRCVGTMRFTYNNLVAKWKSGDKYDRKTYQKATSLLRQSTPWMREVSSRAAYEAADNFHLAATNFFNSRKGTRKGSKAKPPTFKKKSKSALVVRFSHQSQFSVSGRNLKIPMLDQEILMREHIRFNGQVKSLSIKFRAGKWFASFAVELAESPLSKIAQTQKPSVGVDFGIKVLPALSTGEVVENPTPLKKSLHLLKRRQRQASRKFAKGRPQSNRYKKVIARVARIHKKVADQRGAAQHDLTSNLVKRFGKITIEDLAVSNMLKNRKLSRSISDASWSTIRQQLEYKTKDAGAELVVADRWFASSKICSCCYHKLEKLSLRVRTFVCPECHTVIDRDINAAINLAAYSQKAPPIRGSFQKTDAVDLCKSPAQAVAGLSDGVNINPQPRVSAALTCERTVVIY